MIRTNECPLTLTAAMNTYLPYLPSQPASPPARVPNQPVERNQRRSIPGWFEPQTASRPSIPRCPVFLNESMCYVSLH